MKKKDNKNLVILLIILALILIIGGWWTFNIFNEEAQVVDLEGNTQRQKFSKVRNMAIDNINDFISTGSSEGSIFDDLIDSEQFSNLEENTVSISQDNIGNPKPFSN